MTNNRMLVHGSCAKPFDILGTKKTSTGFSIHAWSPYANKLHVYSLDKKNVLAELRKDEQGVFYGEIISSENTLHYSLTADYGDSQHTYIDPYQFEQEAYHAVHFVDHAPENLYKQIGAQLVNITLDNGNEVSGTRFSVFAPSASAVSLIGDFNHWDRRLHPMQKTDLGYWVLFIPELLAGERYKFHVKDAHGHDLPDKADPLGFYHEQFPSHASIIYDQNAYKWHDASWYSKKRKFDPYHQPMSVYEVHLGSWRRPDATSDKIYLDYHELAKELIEYVTYMGYTHIEVLPVSEFPFDGSWGYQPVGLFAPTSRFGDPDGFKYFVDQCHQHNISVIIDWVPAHFPEDGHGLANFDGTHLYEYEDPRKGWHPDWNSCIYDFGKDTVRQFLVANALFWFDKYHVDGIRVDAVASMLYLDYSREGDNWIPNVDGGNHNYEAISLLKWMNTEVYSKYPFAITIAEESTSFAGVSKPVSSGGLGFGFKWNMGWMNDSLEYISKDPAYRRYHHGELTFSMVYAYDENFILPISHDEVVHGKGSMIQKMPGDDWQKAANLRTYTAFMYGHPGKKLNFMGTEFAQSGEWSHERSLDWHLLEYDYHKGIQHLVKALNHMYTSEPALFECDHTYEGFSWVDLNNNNQSIISFIRKSKKRENIVVVCNFTPVPHKYFKVGVEYKGNYKLLLSSDDSQYGGSGFSTISEVVSEKIVWNDRPNCIEISVPPLSTVFYKLV